MEQYEGILELEYRGQTKRIEYKMDLLGGIPHIYFQDKRGKHYQFFYRPSTGEWLYGYNVPVPFPQDFQRLLFAAFNDARITHGL